MTLTNLQVVSSEGEKTAGGRRQVRMPSLPEWVGSRIDSVRDADRRSTVDGELVVLPRLPVSLILSSAERAEVANLIREIENLLAQTPYERVERERETLAIIGTFMLSVPAVQQNDIGAEASAEAFLIALEDVPTWAVEAALRRWYRGECGLDARGKPHDYHWRPAPAELRRIAMVEVWPARQRVATLRRLLAAEPRTAFSESHRATMLARLASIKISNVHERA
jgi:hypothetical protein